MAMAMVAGAEGMQTGHGEGPGCRLRASLGNVRPAGHAAMPVLGRHPRPLTPSASGCHPAASAC